MAGSNYVWDTNTAIYYLKDDFSNDPKDLLNVVFMKNQPVISVITEIELLSWKFATNEDTKTIKGFINTAVIIELQQEVKENAAEIRKLYKIKLPDAIIAASALAYDLGLITRNVKDFKNIENLKLLNPWDSN